MNEIEDLMALADECREWARSVETSQGEAPPPPEAFRRELMRIADKLDTIAKRLGSVGVINDGENW